jgi:spore cortex biosynthesis protein YabQ
MITKPGRLLLAVFDLLFWILAALFSFTMLFKVNGGEIRLYAFIGLALGWGLYTLAVGSIVVKFLVKVYEIVSNIILWPIRMIGRGIKWLAKKIPVKKFKKSEESNNV